MHFIMQTHHPLHGVYMCLFEVMTFAIFFLHLTKIALRLTVLFHTNILGDSFHIAQTPHPECVDGHFGTDDL